MRNIICVAEVLLQRHSCFKRIHTQKKFATESLLQMFLQQDDEGTGPLDGPDQTDVEAADLNQFIFYPLRHFC